MDTRPLAELEKATRAALTPEQKKRYKDATALSLRTFMAAELLPEAVALTVAYWSGTDPALKADEQINAGRRVLDATEALGRYVAYGDDPVRWLVSEARATKLRGDVLGASAGLLMVAHALAVMLGRDPAVDVPQSVAALSSAESAEVVELDSWARAAGWSEADLAGLQAERAEILAEAQPSAEGACPG